MTTKQFTDEDGNSFSFEELLEQSEINNNHHLANDKEWNEEIYIHKHSLVEAFAHGIISSYPWYKGYKLPENFEKVMNEMSIMLQDVFKDSDDCEVVQISLLKLRTIYKRLAMLIPEYIFWNDIGSPSEIGITTRFDPVKNEPSFIDLDVPPHNAVIYLRNCERDNKRFDEEFERKYGKLEK